MRAMWIPSYPGSYTRRIFITMKKLIGLLLVLALMLGTTGLTALAEGEKPVYGTNFIWDGNAAVNGGEPVEITVWAPSGTIGDYYVAWADEYMKLRENVKVNVELTTDDIATKVILATNSNTAPEMFFTHNAWTNAIVNTCGMPWTKENGIDIEALKADYADLEGFEYGGNYYYIVIGTMTNGVFYNKAAWTEAGLTDADIPKTWDELIAVAKKLTVIDDSGKMTRAGFGFNGNQSFLLEALNYNDGLPLFETDGNTPIIDDPIVAKNIQFILDLYDLHQVNSRELDTAANTFATGESAMVFNWGWLTYALKSTAPDMEFGYFQTPVAEAGKVYPSYGRNGGDSSLAISAKITDEAKKAAAADFLTYMLANDDAVFEFCELLSMYPRKISLREDTARIEANVVFRVLKDYVERTVWPGPVPGSYIDTNYITYVVDPIFFNGADIASTLKDAQAYCTDALIDEVGWFYTERVYAHADEFIR